MGTNEGYTSQFLLIGFLILILLGLFIAGSDGMSGKKPKRKHKKKLTKIKKQETIAEDIPYRMVKPIIVNDKKLTSKETNHGHDHPS